MPSSFKMEVKQIETLLDVDDYLCSNTQFTEVGVVI